MGPRAEDYAVFVARDEESNAGWVWVRDSQARRRGAVKITNLEGYLSTYCELRTIDSRFRDKYYEKRRSGTVRVGGSATGNFRDFAVQEVDGDLSGRARRLPLPKDGPIIVIGEWYRNHLGIPDSTHRTKKKARLVIEPQAVPVWAELRVAAHHPDPMVRLATRLGVLGAWLGVLGITDPVLKVLEPEVKPGMEAYIMLAVALAAAFIGVVSCRGAKLG